MCWSTGNCNHKHGVETPEGTVTNLFSSPPGQRTSDRQEMDAAVAAPADGGGDAEGWRQVESHAAVNVARGDLTRSRRTRHAVATLFLALFGAVAVLATLSRPDSSEELVGLPLAPKSAQVLDANGLPVIPGIRSETQDVINSGAWDSKVRTPHARGWIRQIILFLRILPSCRNQLRGKVPAYFRRTV